MVEAHQLLPFECQFITGATFDQVAGLYIFDRKLRLVLLDAIERVEAALRTGLTYGIAHKHGPFGHVDAGNFDPRFDHSRLWNRELAVKPMLPRASRAWPYVLVGSERLYCVLVILRHTLLRAWPKCRWRERLFDLLDRHPEVELTAMQFPSNWRNLPPWTDTGR